MFAIVCKDCCGAEQLGSLLWLWGNTETWVWDLIVVILLHVAGDTLEVPGPCMKRSLPWISVGKSSDR